MSRITRGLVGATAALVTAGFAFGAGAVVPVDSALAPVTAVAKAKKYKNCTELNKTYKHGVR